ncbi:MAG: DUF5615 family PIN-like protein [Bacteroidota bacterium]
MKFLGDMGISWRTIEWLRSEGHDAVHLRERGQQRLEDEQILDEAKREGRVVLTMDLDFGYLMAVSRAKLPSVVIFRLSDETPKFVNTRLKTVLSESGEALKHGAIISVADTRHKVRMLPIVKKK